MDERTDITALIAAFAAAATEPHELLTPAPVRNVRWRRDAQRRFDAVGLPRGLRVA
jgi:hypothetical protein